MILEQVDIRIHSGQQEEFEAALENGLKNVIGKAKGFLGYRINRGIETPNRYILLLYWETIENHTIDFRESPAFPEWRGIVGPFFAKPPAIEHFNLLEQSL